MQVDILSLAQAHNNPSLLGEVLRHRLFQPGQANEDSAIYYLFAPLNQAFQAVEDAQLLKHVRRVAGLDEGDLVNMTVVTDGTVIAAFYCDCDGWLYFRVPDGEKGFVDLVNDDAKKDYNWRWV